MSHSIDDDLIGAPLALFVVNDQSVLTQSLQRSDDGLPVQARVGL